MLKFVGSRPGKPTLVVAIGAVALPLPENAAADVVPQVSTCWNATEFRGSIGSEAEVVLAKRTGAQEAPVTDWVTETVPLFVIASARVVVGDATVPSVDGHETVVLRA